MDSYTRNMAIMFVFTQVFTLTVPCELARAAAPQNGQRVCAFKLSLVILGGHNRQLGKPRREWERKRRALTWELGGLARFLKELPFLRQ